MTGTLLQTPLHAWHAAHGGRLVDFAGWSMPVQYASIVAEHNATRTAVGLFDVSHMGRLEFTGPAAEAFLDGLVTRRVAGMPAGAVRYSLVTNEQGGILDDVLVYRMPDHDGSVSHQLVVNAGNRQKILAWIDARLPGFPGASYVDRTRETAMIAVQGPRAASLLAPLVEPALDSMKYYTVRQARVASAPAWASRTGYTGEDGWELIMPAASAVGLWESLVAAGGTPAGLGARDTLRLEAGMPLYGHELSESIDPYAADLAFAVQLDGRAFPGREALAALSAAGDPPQRRVGVELDGRRVARENQELIAAQRRVGFIASGTFSPTLQRPIAMGYVEREFSAPGTELTVDIRGHKEQARIVSLPFYRRK